MVSLENRHLRPCARTSTAISVFTLSPSGSVPCAEIEFDYAKGGGTITRFEPATDGVSVLATWKLYVNGAERTNRIGFTGGRIYVKHKGMSVVFR